ncbi:6-phosphogluconolactonase [Lysobacter sp. A289]
MSIVDVAGPLPQRVRWHQVEGSAVLTQAACLWVLDASKRAIAARGRFVLVLSGGRTPQDVHALLRTADTDWSRWEIWFGDERCLPVDDPGRNSLMANDAWLSHVPIPSGQVHVMPAELGAEAAARAYAEALKAPGQNGSPSASAEPFDMVMLGIGEDGHTASLFPGHDWGVPDNADDVLAVFDSPKPPSQRVSLSAARLSRAREVLFLIEGDSKRDAVAQWRTGNDLPVAAICPPAGVDVLLDASLLPAAGDPA